MANTKTILGFIAGAAIGTIAYILATRVNKVTNQRRKMTGKPGYWKDNTTDSFTGWLEKLKKAIDKEVKQEEHHAPEKINTGLISQVP